MNPNTKIAPTTDGFVLVRRDTYEYNHAHQVIRTTHADGTAATASWICKGPLSVTDENGLTTDYRYNSAKTLYRVTRDVPSIHPDYRQETDQPIPPVTEETSYNGQGLPLERRATRGQTVSTHHYTYDLAGRIATETDPMGLVTSYAYSEDGLTTTRTTPTGATYITQLHSDGFLALEAGTGQAARYYFYDISGDGIVTTVRLDAPDGPILHRKTINALGQLVSETTADYTKTFSYDSRGRLTGTRLQGLHPGDIPEIETMEYDPLGQLIRHTTHFDHHPGCSGSPDRVREWKYTHTLEPSPLDHDSQLPFRKKTTREFAATGHAIKSIEKDYLGEHLVPDLLSLGFSTDKYGASTTRYTLNKDGNTLQITTADSFEGEIKTLTIDGRPILAQSPDGGSIHYAYGHTPQGTCLTQTSPGGLVETTQYDLNSRPISYNRNGILLHTSTYDPGTGLLVLKTYSDGSKEQYSHDHRGRVTSQYGTAVHPCRFEYDNHDHLTALVTSRTSGDEQPLPANGGDTTRWTYCPLTGQLLDKQYPDGSTSQWTYDYKGRPLREQTPGGQTITYGYGPFSNEPVSIRYSDQTPPVDKTYNHLGQLTSVTDAGGSRDITYDSLADPAAEHCSTPAGQVLQYTRDSLGRTTVSRLLKDGQTIHEEQFTYDSLGRLSAVGIDGGEPLAYTYEESLGGLLSRISYPFACDKNITYQEQTRLPAGITYRKKDGSLITSQSLTRNDMDLITRIEDRTPTEERLLTYGYNTRGELTTCSQPEPDPGGTTSLSYDSIGNRTLLEANGQPIGYTANALNQYTRISSGADEEFQPEYDIRGNQTLIKTSTGIWTVAYGLNNRPVSFTQGDKKIRCLYDSQGRRVEKTYLQGGSPIARRSYTYQDYLLIAEWDTTRSTPVLLNTYHWDAREQIATRPVIMTQWTGDTPRRLAFLHTGNKDVRHLVDEEGNTVAAYTYDAFGGITEEFGPAAPANPFRFSSEYYDEELGLIYYNFRHYNPADGRWISRDPLEEKETFNLYSFVRNNPVSAIDKLGLSTAPIASITYKITWGGENLSTGKSINFNVGVQSGPDGWKRDSLYPHLDAGIGVSYRLGTVGDKNGGFGSWDANIYALVGLRSGISDKNWRYNIPSSDSLNPFPDNSKYSLTFGYINNTRLDDTRLNTHYWMLALSIGDFRIQTHNDAGLGTDQAHTSSGEIGYGPFGVGWDMYTGTYGENSKHKPFTKFPGNWKPSPEDKFEYFVLTQEEMSYNKSRWYARCWCNKNFALLGEVWDNGLLQNLFHYLINQPGFPYQNQGYDFRGGFQLTL